MMAGLETGSSACGARGRSHIGSPRKQAATSNWRNPHEDEVAEPEVCHRMRDRWSDRANS